MIRIALAFVLGVFFLQQQPMLPKLYWVVLPVISLSLYFSIRRFKPAGKVVLTSLLAIASSFLLGFFWAAVLASIRMSDALPDHLQNKTMTIVGVVASSVEHLERGERFRFDVEKVLTENAQVPRHISLSYYPSGHNAPTVSRSSVTSAKFKVGQRWQLVVKLKRPHGTQNPHGYDFEAWALSENIRATGTVKTKAHHQKLQSFVWHPRYAMEYLRDGVKQRIASVLQSKPYRGILQALVMGDDAEIAASDWQLFLRTGTTHLMSISGLHITMLSGLAFALGGLLWRRFPVLVMRLPTRKAATLFGAIVAFIYVLLAGFAVPAQRTLYMLLVFAMAIWTGRQMRISQVLSVALLTVVVLDPWAVISAGFWLSFMAVAMLAYAFAARVAVTGWLKAALQSQWVVTVGMLPMLLIMFHQASIISPVANAFAIPLISFVVTPLALMGSFLPIDAMLKLAYVALEVCMQMLDWLNHAPNVVWQQHAPPVWTLLPASVGMIWLLLPSGFPLRSLGLLGLLPMLLLLPARVAHGDMKVAILDVGQGLSVVVQTANHTLLYDAGPKSSAQTDAAKRVILPYLQGEGVSRLNAFVLSHDDVDHTGGAGTLISSFPIDLMTSSLALDRVQLYPAVRHRQCVAGQGWTWDGVHFTVLHPQQMQQDDADNNRSCVLKVVSASGSLLLTGDIEKLAEQQLLAHAALNTDKDLLKADVLVAPHHGSKTSSSQAFIAAVAPSLTVFTVGYLNRFRHPAAEIVSRYQAMDSEILRSDHEGAILLQFTANKPDSQLTNHAYQAVAWRHHQQRYWHDHYL